MKKHLIALAVALGSLAALPTQAAVVSISPSVTNALTGGSFSLDVNISGLSANELVSTFDLNIYFNAAVLKGTGFTLGSGLGGPWDSSLSGGPQGDSFDLFAYSLTFDPNLTQTENDDALAALQTDGSFTLATLNFEAIGAGVSFVSFGLGANERDIVGRDSQWLPNLQFSGACVAVNSPTAGGQNNCEVPEPSSYGLLGLALLGAAVPGAWKRRNGGQRG